MLCGGFDLGTCLMMRCWGPGALAVVGPAGICLLISFAHVFGLFAVGSLSVLYLLFIS